MKFILCVFLFALFFAYASAIECNMSEDCSDTCLNYCSQSSISLCYGNQCYCHVQQPSFIDAVAKKALPRY